MGSCDSIVVSKRVGCSRKESMVLRICVLAMVLSKYRVRVVEECVHVLFVM